MKEVCFIIPNLKNGGGNRVFVELSNQLILNGWRVTLVHPNNTLDKITYFINSKISIRKIGRFSEFKIVKFWNLILILLFVRYSCSDKKVVISDPIISILFILAPAKNLVRYIQNDDYAIFDDGMVLPNKAILWVFKKLTLISYKKKIEFVFNSRFVYEQFIKKSDRSDVPFKLIYPAVDHDIFKNLEYRDWDDDKKINLCIIARKHPFKGFLDFVRAWSLVRSELKEYVGTIYVVSHDDLSLFDLSLSDVKDFSIIMPMSDSEISRIMNHSHLFISPSWMEGFGLPPLEAMSCGCACIISNSGGVLEYAKNDDNCLMFEPRNLSQLKQLIRKAVKSRITMRNIAVQGELSSRRFSWNKSSLDFEQVLLNKYND